MSRIYIGFSSPIAYDYTNQATRTLADLTSSPNPILIGVTGMLVLFDEIWFPCRSLCPESMRNLSYVKFFSESDALTTIDHGAAKAYTDQADADISPDNIYTGGYGSFMKNYYGDHTIDSHTHDISFGAESVRGSPNYENLALDLLILDQGNQGFTHALNGLTRRMTFPEGLEWLRNDSEDKAIRAADNILSISSIYDLTGPAGPYHPVLEELRDHDFVRSFRKWVRDKTGPLHNRSTEDVLAEMNELTSDFTTNALRKAVGTDGLRDVSITLAESIALDAMPGASTVKTLFGLRKSASEKEVRKMSAFIAESKAKVWNAHQKTRFHFF